MYFLLSMPYFYLAHGGYSNRFAFMAWLFLPFLYSTFISCMNINNRNFSVIAVFILFIGCVKYISVLNFGIIEILFEKNIDHFKFCVIIAEFTDLKSVV